MKTLIRHLALAGLLATSSAHADLDYIRQAAEAGNAEAQLELGILFQYGFNYKDNEVPALTWYTLSANQGNSKAAQLRDTLKAKMNDKEVGEAMEQVANYKPKAAAGSTTYPTLRAPTPAPAPVAPEPAPSATPAPAPASQAAPPSTAASAEPAPAAEPPAAVPEVVPEVPPAAIPETAPPVYPQQ